MMHLKMSGDLYDDVKTVKEAVDYLHAMVDTLEQECIIRDKDKPASELFIYINTVKNDINKMAHYYDKILRRADIDQFGTLSKYARPYLGF